MPGVVAAADVEAPGAAADGAAPEGAAADVCGRGNGPLIDSTGTGARALDAPGITGNGRETCEGAMPGRGGGGTGGRPPDGGDGMGPGGGWMPC